MRSQSFGTKGVAEASRSSGGEQRCLRIAGEIDAELIAFEAPRQAASLTREKKILDEGVGAVQDVAVRRKSPQQIGKGMRFSDFGEDCGVFE